MERPNKRKLEYFSNLLTCGQSLYYWNLSPDLQIHWSTCPEEDMIFSFLALGDCEDYLTSYIEDGHELPLVLSDTLGLSWISTFETADGEISRVHMIGPAFNSDFSSRRLDQELSTHYPTSMIRQLLEEIRVIPIISLSSWFQYGMMLHYTVTGQKINISNFNYQPKMSDESSSELSGGTGELPPNLENEPNQSTFLAEQKALAMIEHGCEDYQQSYGRLSMSAEFIAGSAEMSASPNRKYKNAFVAFVTLCTRAAIRGGLDVETAYFIGNRYLDNIESVSSLSELMHLNGLMYDDFVQRVRKAQEDSRLSPGVRICCNYIQLHLNERIQLSDIAQKVGYSDYYLSRKFKEETGMTLNRYITEKKIERAKTLLQSSFLSVQEISDSLNFCNASYFINAFRKTTGISPKEWRESSQADNHPKKAGI